jgi:hypothetical protein
MNQVVTVAPDRRAVAAIEDAVLVARGQRPPGGRRNRPAGMPNLVVKLAGTEDPRDRCVAGVPADGFRWDRAPAF